MTTSNSRTAKLSTPAVPEFTPHPPATFLGMNIPAEVCVSLQGSCSVQQEGSQTHSHWKRRTISGASRKNPNPENSNFLL